MFQKIHNSFHKGVRIIFDSLANWSSNKNQKYKYFREKIRWKNKLSILFPLKKYFKNSLLDQIIVELPPDIVVVWSVDGRAEQEEVDDQIDEFG